LTERTYSGTLVQTLIGESSRRMKRSKTPTFLLELPLALNAGQAKRQQAHFEAARALYNALLGEALARLHRMWADPAQAGRHVPFQRHRNGNVRLPSPTCDRSMASLSMPCTITQSTPTVRGLLTISMP
jgi:hypothetical protein